jgi:hypothetical protein
VEVPGSIPGGRIIWKESMSKDQEHFFMIGWYRSRHEINHATRRQMRKAEKSGSLKEFWIGWSIQQLLCVLFEGNPNLDAKVNDMGLPMAFYTKR